MPAFPFPWYAIRVRSNYEFRTSAVLRAQGYEEFLPSYRVRSRWSDRWKETTLPLLPGYVLCRFDVHFRLPILMTPGVVHIVGIGKTPVPVDEFEVAALRRIADAQVTARPWPFLRVHDPVTVALGPLAGLEGVLVEIKNTYRVVVSVTLLQRSVAVEVDASWILPASLARRPPAAEGGPSAAARGFDAA